MSLQARILCRSGCGDVGDPELEYFCVDCHGDRAEARRERELRQFISAKKLAEAKPISPVSALSPEAAPPPPSTRRALQEFLNRAREKDESVVTRENQFLARELEIRETSKEQLRKYMVATDEGEPVDPKEWSRYTYGAPRDVPRHDVDEATELAAQTKLFCAWRQRTMRNRMETRRQISLAAEKERAKQQSFSAKLLASSPLKKVKSKSAFGAARRESLTVTLQGMVPKMAKEAQKAAAKRASLLVPSRSKKSVDTPPLAT